MLLRSIVRAHRLPLTAAAVLALAATAAGAPEPPPDPDGDTQPDPDADGDADGDGVIHPDADGDGVPDGAPARSPYWLDFEEDPAVEMGPFGTKPSDGEIEVWKPGEDGTGEVAILDGEVEPAGGKPAASYDVGVIPEYPGACPAGSEYVVIHTDDEDNQNNSYTSGWTGAIVREGSGTSFGFCRVDGTQLQAIPQASYAVLSLGSNCPTGSHYAYHHFDNENHNTDNWTVGNYAPSTSWNGYVALYPDGDTTLALCVFPPDAGAFAGPITSYFPDFGITYGVFGDNDFPHWLAHGHVHTDDEDNGNWNSQPPSDTSNDADLASYVYETWGQARTNSELEIAKAKKPPCPQPCPKPGSWYDGANCYVATPPGGTTPFAWNGGLYHSPVMAPTCPSGGAWDGNACYIQVPPGRTPFIWQGNLYYTGPSCPVPGSSWDGNACYIPVPSGSTPFIWQGNLYYSAVWGLANPKCPLPGSAWDGNACYFGAAPAGTTPFVWQGHLYYSPVCHP